MLNLSQIIESQPAFRPEPGATSAGHRAPHWFITGGLGYIGRHLVQRLGELRTPCIVLTRSTSPPAPHGMIQFVHGDVSQRKWGLNPDQWQLLGRSSVVVHLAGELGTGKSLRQLAPVNSDAVEPLLHCLHHGARVLHLSSLSVFASSSWPVHDPCPESFPFTDEAFSGGYAQSKVLAEHHLVQHFDTGDLTICRPSLVIGDGALPSRHLLHLFLEALRQINGIPETIPDEEASVCQVEWLAECLVKIGTAKGNGLDFCHLAQAQPSLHGVVRPLRLPTLTNREFSERLEHLSPFNRTLLRNAFLKPQPARHRDHDLFQSTGRTYQMDHLTKYLI